MTQPSASLPIIKSSGPLSNDDFTVRARSQHVHDPGNASHVGGYAKAQRMSERWYSRGPEFDVCFVRAIPPLIDQFSSKIGQVWSARANNRPTDPVPFSSRDHNGIRIIGSSAGMECADVAPRRFGATCH